MELKQEKDHQAVMNERAGFAENWQGCGCLNKQYAGWCIGERYAVRTFASKAESNRQKNFELM